MIVFYETKSSTSAEMQFDGRYYMLAEHEMYARPDGKMHIRSCSRKRLLRVSHFKGGLAYASLGRAGEAISSSESLPRGVICEQEIYQ